MKSVSDMRLPWLTTAAAIDRLVHHSVILDVNLPSYRLESAKQSKAAITEE